MSIDVQDKQEEFGINADLDWSAEIDDDVDADEEDEDEEPDRAEYDGIDEEE